MNQAILEDIATDGALLAEYLARRGVPVSDVATVVAGAMPGIVAFETARDRGFTPAAADPPAGQWPQAEDEPLVTPRGGPVRPDWIYSQPGGLGEPASPGGPRQDAAVPGEL